MNNPGEIRIVSNQEDLYVQPSESYLIIEGRLKKKTMGQRMPTVI